MMQAVTVLQQPSYEPVSLAEMQDWCKAPETGNVAPLRTLRQAMREYAENKTGRAYIRRKLQLLVDCWPWDPYYGVKIVLPQPPLISVESFQYIDMNGVVQTLAADQYAVHDDYEPGFIIPVWGVVWPTIRKDPKALQITYWAGYAPGSPDDEAGQQEVVPAALKLWMEARALTLFDKRDQLVVGSVMKIPYDYTDGLLDALTIGSRLF